MKRARKKGITLVEMVVSIFIFSSVMISVLSLYSFAVTESYKQSRGMNAHVGGTGHVEKHDMGVMQNVAKSKEIKLFGGLSATELVGSGVSVDVTADTFGLNKKTVVAINASDQDIFEYLEGEHGRVGPKFASLLLPQEVNESSRPLPVEYRNKTAVFFTFDEANYKHSKMDFSKYRLPSGNYKLRYLLYDVDTYRKMLSKHGNVNDSYNAYAEHKPVRTEEKVSLMKSGKDVFSSSNILGSDVEQVSQLKLPTHKVATNKAAWTFFDKKPEDLLAPGKYVLVFELTLDRLDSSVNAAEALKIFKNLKHFSGINSMSEIQGEKKMIARDIVFLESLKPNVFVNAGKELYIGSDFDGFNLTKQALGRSDGTMEHLGELPNARLYVNKNGEGEGLARRGFIYNQDDERKTSIYSLSPTLVCAIPNPKVFLKSFFKFEWYSESPASLATYASSTSPYGNKTKGVTAFIDKKGQLLHTDQRFSFATGASSIGKAHNTGRQAQYFLTKNDRLFNANTYNIALLKGLWEGGKGKKKYHDRDGEILLLGSYRWVNKNRNVKVVDTAYRFSDLYVDLGNDPNQPNKQFLGLTGNSIIEIGTKSKEDDSADLQPVKYVFARYKDFPNSENLEEIAYSQAIAGNAYLGGVSFLKFYPLTEDQYVILAKKGDVYRLYSLFRDLKTTEVKDKIFENKNIVLDISHSSGTINKSELESEIELFQAEVVQRIMESVKAQVRDQVEAYKAALHESIKRKLSLEDERLRAAVIRFVDLKLEEKIKESFSEVIKNIKVTQKKNWLGQVSLSATVKANVWFTFDINDHFGYNEYVVSETLYPEFFASSNEDIKFLYENIGTIGFGIHGNDLYVHADKRLYRLIPKGINNSQEVFNLPIRILETTTPIKNLYIYETTKVK